MQKSSQTNQKLLIYLAFALMFLSLDHQSRLNSLKNVVITAATPVLTPLYLFKSAINSNIVFLKNIPHQNRIIKDLERKHNEIALVAQQAQSFKNELDAIKSSKNFIDTNSRKLESAKIINLERSATLNKGSNDNLKSGYAVIRNNALLGIIINTMPNSSQLRLLKDPETSISVVTLNGTSGKLIYKNNELLMTEILQKSTLNAEEPIYTKGSEMVPSGLLVGTVVKISESTTSVYKQATIKNSIDVYDEQFVTIILD